VKLESDASDEPPRHQATTPTEAGAARRHTAEAAQPPERGTHTNTAEAMTGCGRDPASTRHASLEGGKPPTGSPDRPPKRRERDRQSRSPQSRERRSARDVRAPKRPSGYSNATRRTETRRWDCCKAAKAKMCATITEVMRRTGRPAIPGPRSPTSGYYSADESVLCSSRCRCDTAYPSMGFVPLQGDIPLVSSPYDWPDGHKARPARWGSHGSGEQMANEQRNPTGSSRTEVPATSVCPSDSFTVHTVEQARRDSRAPSWGF